MSIVTIRLGNKEFKLSCAKENSSQLMNLSEHLNSEIDKIRRDNPTASFELLLVMTALSLQDEKLVNFQNSGNEILENVKMDFQYTLSTIAKELKTVAEKLEKC
ncbi:MAG: cell division protein ZapA [Rickettsiaceae bacterium]|nr:cell division protein ZapA [Rickettsiaceae bacterium]